MPPEEKTPEQQQLDNLDPEAPPDQTGTTSQGWTHRDTTRREKFQQHQGVSKDELDKDDQQPTDPNAQES